MVTRLDLIVARFMHAVKSSGRKACIAIPLAVMAIFTIAGLSPAYASVGSSVNSSGQVVQSVKSASALESSMLSVNSALGAQMPAAYQPGDRGDGGFSSCPGSGSYSSSNNLAISRWGDASSQMHARQGAKGWQDITQKISRYNIDTTLLSLGNTEFSTGTNWVQMASQFCPADSIGAKFDSVGGSIAKSIWNSGIIAGIVVVGLVIFVLGAMRRSPDWKWLVRTIAILGVFGVMMTAAAQSDPASGKLATGSPGWVISQANKSISGLASTVTANQLSNNLVNDTVRTVAYPNPTVLAADKGNTASCLNFLNQMQKDYSTQNVGNDAAVIPQQMDAMWQMTGLPAYVRTQFGSQNNYGWQTFCWSLDRNAGISRDITATTANKMGLPKPTQDTGGGKAWWNNAGPFWLASSNTDIDEVGVFGAQCQFVSGAWKVAPGFDITKNPDATKGDLAKDEGAKQCSDAWNGKTTIDGATWSDYAWNWQDGTDNITKGTTDNTAALIDNGWHPADFLGAFHGNSGASNSMSAAAYVVIALILMIVFGGLALVVFLMKLALVFMGVVVFFVMLAEIFPGREGTQLGKFVKQLLGFGVMAFGFSLILGVLMSATSVVVSAGPALGISGLSLNLWVGFAPLLALFVFSWAWKHFVKAPNPLNPKSMMAYTRSSGSIGSAAGGGMGALGRTGSSLGRSALSGAAFGFGRNAENRFERGGAGGGGGGRGRSANGLAGGMGGNIGADTGADLDPKAGLAGDGGAGAGTGPAAAAAGAMGGNALAGMKDRLGSQRELRANRRTGQQEFNKAFGGGTQFAGTGRTAQAANTFIARRRHAAHRFAAHPLRSMTHGGANAAALGGAAGVAGAAGLVATAALAPAVLAAGGAAGAVMLARRFKPSNMSARRASTRQMQTDMFTASRASARSDAPGPAVTANSPGNSPDNNAPSSQPVMGSGPASAPFSNDSDNAGPSLLKNENSGVRDQTQQAPSLVPVGAAPSASVDGVDGPNMSGDNNSVPSGVLGSDGGNTGSTMGGNNDGGHQESPSPQSPSPAPASMPIPSGTTDSGPNMGGGNSGGSSGTNDGPQVTPSSPGGSGGSGGSNEPNRPSPSPDNSGNSTAAPAQPPVSPLTPNNSGNSTAAPAQPPSNSGNNDGPAPVQPPSNSGSSSRPTDESLARAESERLRKAAGKAARRAAANTGATDTASGHTGGDAHEPNMRDQ